MTTARISVLSIALFVATVVPRAAESQPQSNLEPKIEKGQSSNVKLTFSTKATERYQVYVTHDLKEWEFFGNVIQGTDRPITVEYANTAQKAAFFKVEPRPMFAPVLSRIERGPKGEVLLSFPTVAGRRYLAYSSLDLARWDSFSDLVDGKGSREQGEIDISGVPEAFFRVEAVDVLPLPSMVWVKPGTFVMGSPVDEKDRDLDEDPLTQVVFQSGFWMGKYEVTQREYEKIMGANPSWFKGDASRPVELVSWEEAVAYCTRLTQTEFAAGRLPLGYVYRLPTEAEFEYTCRAGTTTRFYFGDDLDYSLVGDYAWSSENSGEATHPVGQKKPNPLGLYDMCGNVAEWCLDWYQDPYPGGNITGAVGPATGTSKVFRGGSWLYKAAVCRSAFRDNVSPSRRAIFIGFRVVLGPVVF